MLTLSQTMPKQANTKAFVAVSDLFLSVRILDAAKRAGMQAEVVATPEELRERMSDPPAMIIFDLNLDRMQPIQFISELKSRAETKGIGLIAFVSHVQGELKRQAHEAGCDIVLAKSAFFQNLPQVLRRYSGVV